MTSGENSKATLKAHLALSKEALQKVRKVQNVLNPRNYYSYHPDDPTLGNIFQKHGSKDLN